MEAELIVAIGRSEGLRIGVVGAAFLYGLRHGIDLDHLAAISDITASQSRVRRSIFLATVYALGHAAVVVALGVLAILAGRRLPAGVDDAMEHVVGVSLLLLGGYVFYSLVRYGRDFRLRSRWAVLYALVRRTLRWFKRAPAPAQVEIVHSHPDDDPGHTHLESPATAGVQRAAVAVAGRRRHRHVLPLPEDPFVEYGVLTAGGIGMLHGIGAETPSQVLLLIAAAGVGGAGAGLVLLGAFVSGLLVSNTAVAVGTTLGFARGQRAPTIYLTLAVVTGLASIAMGLLYVSGKAGLIPSIFG